MVSSLISALVLLLPVTSAASVSAGDGASPPDASGRSWEMWLRLPTATVPHRYDLLIFPNLTGVTFSGRVAIQVEILEDTDSIVLHSKKLDVRQTRVLKNHLGLGDVTGGSAEDLRVRKAFSYEPHDFWVVLLEELAPKGSNCTLYFEFEGSLDQGIHGFYRSSYRMASGEVRYLATTQFEPTDARRAFPCFDEPLFKAKFKIAVVRPSREYTALSNMPAEEELPDSPVPEFTTVRFAESIPMTTYLVCFIVCDFSYSEQETTSSVRIRVYSRPDQIGKTAYATSAAKNLTEFFEDYFMIDYPLPKQDLIAVPDFASGAMENWGLITFSERNLLWEQGKNSLPRKLRVATVIAHELAHQWFGNLVTMKWWDDLWLNEGFASYMESKGLGHVEPNLDVVAAYELLDALVVKRLDSAVNSHPIRQKVSDPSEINEIFDSISYEKGSTILRMLEHFMGSESFRMGIHNYLQRFAYSNAATLDLWNELQLASDAHLPIASIMDTWTLQKGYPVLEVADLGKGAYRIGQSKFPFHYNLSAEDVDKSAFSYKWDVPIVYVTSSSCTPSSPLWLKRNSKHLVLNTGSEAKWLKLNAGLHGYYRVSYPEAVWGALSAQLEENHKVLTEADRANLVDDVFSIAMANGLKYDVPLRMVQYIRRETGFVAWKTASHHLFKIAALLRGTPDYGPFQRFVWEMLKSSYEGLGWYEKPTDSPLDKLLREEILNLACSSEYPLCLQEAERLLKRHIEQDFSFLPSHLINLVYKYGMQTSGNEEIWNAFWERYTKELDIQEKSSLMLGLSSVHNATLLSRLLQLSQNRMLVRKHEFMDILTMVSGNKAGNPIVWDYYRNEWPKLVEEFGLTSRRLGSIFLYINVDSILHERMKEMKRFIAENPEAGAGKASRSQALEAVEKNLFWSTHQVPAIRQWLDSYFVQNP